MRSLLPAEPAVFFQLNPVRGVFLILFSRIIPLFTLGTGQRYDYPHCRTPPLLPDTAGNYVTCQIYHTKRPIVKQNNN